MSLSLSHTHKLFSGCWRWEVRAHEWAFFSMYDIYIFPRYPFHLSITNQTATTLTQLQTELSWEKLDTIKKKKAVDNSDLCQNLKRITFVMKQNGFKSRWLTGTVLPHCSGKKTNEYFEKASPEVKKKKTLEIVAYCSKKTRNQKKNPLKWFDYSCSLKNNTTK